MSVAHGRFVVLEGGDGCGKSTQARALARRLEAAGHSVVLTFEPGATTVGRAIRSVVLDGADAVEPRAEALLMAADRAQHVSEVIRPALDRGDWVVSDRFTPSSLAYQGTARGLGVAEIAQLSAWAADGLAPDLVVVLDVDDETAEARRAAERGRESDRMEREHRAFHAGVRHAYRHLAASHGWTVVDGSGTPEEVEAAVWSEVERLLAPGAR